MSIVHGLVALFLKVITLAIIFLLIGLVALVVLFVAIRMIMALIVMMTTVGSSILAIALVTLMVLRLLVTMLPVAQIMAACDGKMSRLLLFWLLIVLGNLLTNACLFIGSLTLLKKGNTPKRVRGHHLVCLRKLKLMHLGMHKEDLFALLLLHG
jgi:hypothetical protein